MEKVLIINCSLTKNPCIYIGNWNNVTIQVNKIKCERYSLIIKRF